MLKKLFSITLASLLILTTCFAQTTSTKLTDLKTPPKLTRADFYNTPPLEINFEKDSYKSQIKKNYFSSAAKTALLVSLLGGGVVAVVILATRNKRQSNNSPCTATAQIGVPCPPGCFCIQ